MRMKKGKSDCGIKARISHVILQRLPADTSRKVLHIDYVFGALRKSVFLLPRFVSASSVAVAVTTSWRRRASVSIPFPPGVSISFGQLDLDATSADRFPVQVVDGIVGIARVFKLDEAVSLLQTDLLQNTITLEKLFHVSLRRLMGQIPHEDSRASRHDPL